jgi:hypothetical protein
MQMRGRGGRGRAGRPGEGEGRHLQVGGEECVAWDGEEGVPCSVFLVVPLVCPRPKWTSAFFMSVGRPKQTESDRFVQ